MYTISDFYMYLKLGLWKSGEVTDWGWIEKIISIQNNVYTNTDTNYTSTVKKMENYYLGKKSIEQYLKKTYFKKMLSNGVFLMDFYLQGTSKGNNDEKESKTYIIVISTNKFGLGNYKCTHILRVTNSLDNNDFRSMITTGKNNYRRKSIYRRKSRSRGIQFFPRKLTRTDI